MKDQEEMFFNKKIAKEFAAKEQNEKNYQTAKILESLATKLLENQEQPYHIAELFAGAHPDRYSNLFEILIKTNGKMDWVDSSPIMLDLAEKYLKTCEDERKKTINFIKKTNKQYLESLPDNSLSLVSIKYSLDYIKNTETFFALLHKKMRKNSSLIANLTTPSNILKSHSTNAKYFYNQQSIPKGKNIKLKDGDSFTIKFFEESGNPNSKLIKGTKTTKYYFSQETITNHAKSQGFKVFTGDYKEFTKEKSKTHLNVLILTK